MPLDLHRATGQLQETFTWLRWVVSRGLARSDVTRAEAGDSGIAVRRESQMISGPEGPIYTALHWPADGHLHELGGAVFICQPLAYEMANAYKILVGVADSLAASGRVVCRFDYYGTGDSSRLLPDCTWAHFCASAECALEYLAARCSSRNLTTLGVRAGALFAAAIARESRTRAALLVDPITSGKKYVDELRYVATIAENKRPKSLAPPNAGEGLNSAGYRFSRQFIDKLESVQLAFPEGVTLGCIDTVRKDRSRAHFATERYIDGDSKRFWAKRNAYRSFALEREVLEGIMELENLSERPAQ